MRRKKVKLSNLRFNWFERFLLIAVVMLTTLVVGIFNIYASRTEKRQVDLICSFMDETSDNQKMLFETYVDEKVRILEALAAYPEIYGMDNEQQRAFLDKRAQTLGFLHFFVMNTDGQGYYIDENVIRNQKKEVFFF